MNAFRTILISAAAVTMIFMPFRYLAGAAAGPKVSQAGNKHNLSAKAWTSDGATYSVSNTNTYRATDDPTGNPGGQQICIFCHTPHNANVEGGAPLWNRAFSTQTFSRYSSQSLEIRKNPATRALAGFNTPAWQPDGSSKLCLSCHDGVATNPLGAVLRGGPIAMAGGDYITGIASFNPSNNKMKTGHHPVSFVYDANVKNAINAPTAKNNTYKLPSDPTPVPEVKLDRNSKMQCTTCHDAHQNQTDDTKCYDGSNFVVNCTGTFTRKVTPFWVYGVNGVAATDRDYVCLACHPLNAGAGFASPWPPP